MGVSLVKRKTDLQNMYLIPYSSNSYISKDFDFVSPCHAKSIQPGVHSRKLKSAFFKLVFTLEIQEFIFCDFLGLRTILATIIFRSHKAPITLAIELQLRIYSFVVKLTSSN